MFLCTIMPRSLSRYVVIRTGVLEGSLVIWGDQTLLQKVIHKYKLVILESINVAHGKQLSLFSIVVDK